MVTKKQSQPQTDTCGTLYVVATPIGNLLDITQRAILTLGSVTAILAEDTRHSRVLLRALAIEKPLFSLHTHNEAVCVSGWINRLKQGESFALISDAGTPLIQDPGHLLVRNAHRVGIRVVPLPGACAAITALCASGLPTQRFCFEGFLPEKSQARKEYLKTLSEERRTLIFYEAPHRLLHTLADMQIAFGQERLATFGRELTKQFETIRQGTLGELLQFCHTDLNQQKGEMVIVVAGKTKPDVTQADLNDKTIKTLQLLLEVLPANQAIRLTVQMTGERKNRLYEYYLKNQSKAHGYRL